MSFPRTRAPSRGVIASLIEEAEAIGWYEQRIAVETDDVARAINGERAERGTQHFGWRSELKRILFTSSDIVSAGEKAEKSTG